MNDGGSCDHGLGGPGGGGGGGGGHKFKDTDDIAAIRKVCGSNLRAPVHSLR